MRFVVLGAGAVGGVVAGRLAEAGQEVMAVARGPHGAALRSRGLILHSPRGTATVRLPVVADVSAIGLARDDVLLLAVKSQQSVDALDAVARAAGSVPPAVVCVQNGVENERVAARRFRRVYGACVLFPATHLRAGEVHAHWAPRTGVLDVGRYPEGTDDLAAAVAAAFRSATFGSQGQPDIMRWKHGKLLMNLGNAVEALHGPAARGSPASRELQTEGAACLDAAGVPYASPEELAERVRSLGDLDDDSAGTGGSTWQSVTRDAPSVETDYLNGEIVLLGRQSNRPTPANEAVQRQMHVRLRRPTPVDRAGPDGFTADFGG